MNRSVRFASFCALALTSSLAAVLGGCQTEASQGTREERLANERATLDTKANNTVASFKETDPGMSKFFDTAVGWAVFPNISQGAFIVGGSAGDGVLFEGGKITGDVDIAAGSIGAQIGGQVFSQIIFFQTKTELDRFKSGNFEFDARASAVAARAGASAAANYVRGVAVFTFSERGLMAQAAIGGQKFTVTMR